MLMVTGTAVARALEHLRGINHTSCLRLSPHASATRIRCSQTKLILNPDNGVEPIMLL